MSTAVSKKHYTDNLVSIVIPTYNQAEFLEETISSVINQTYTNLEIIISDDCSTDGTIEILKSFAEKDKRIRLLLSEENKGIPANFNKAFDVVTGEFVAFLGGDDLMLPEKIEKMVEVLQNEMDVVQVFHDMKVFDSETGKTIYYYGDGNKPPINALDWIFPCYWSFYKKYTSIIPSACVARSDYYLNARYDKRLHYKHELLFTLDNYCAKPSGKWKYIDIVLGSYRIHKNNFSRQKKNTVSIPEETKQLCKIAKSRYPQLKKRIINYEQFFMFRQLVYKQWDTDEMKYYDQKFLQEAGMIKYIYLKSCQFLNKIGILNPLISLINKL